MDLIATRRPFDDPGVRRPYYRLVPLKEAVVSKTHMPYGLDEADEAHLAMKKQDSVTFGLLDFNRLENR